MVEPNTTQFPRQEGHTNITSSNSIGTGCRRFVPMVQMMVDDDYTCLGIISRCISDWRTVS